MLDNNDLLAGTLSIVCVQELLAVLSGKPITGIELIRQVKELPDVFDNCVVFPDIYIEDDRKQPLPYPQRRVSGDCVFGLYLCVRKYEAA